MIEFLRGKLMARMPTGAVLDVSGVGYGVELPLNVVCDLPPCGQEVEFWIHTRVREDSLKLFGFLDLDTRRAFEILLQISGVGPKVALAILSTMSVRHLRLAVESERIEILERVPGIGRRTAEKILVELRAKLAKFPIVEGRVSGGATLSEMFSPEDEANETAASQVSADLHLALSNLGFKDKEISSALQKVALKTDATDFATQLKLALQHIRGTSSHGTEPGTRAQKAKAVDNVF